MTKRKKVCLFESNPEIVKLLKNKELGYVLTYGSHKKEIFICENCGNEDLKTISDVVRRGFSCSKCSDGLSYPEKFMIKVLDQLNVQYVKQKTFNFDKTKKYDFYVNESLIIETHGRQHYDAEFCRVRTLQEEQENDRLKEQMAKENGIDNDDYIVIDCRYSELEWIKNNILNSELKDSYDLSNIDWDECDKFAHGSLMILVCDEWNNGLKNVQGIANKLNLERSTVNKYLNRGLKLDICDYDPKTEMKKSGYSSSQKRKKRNNSIKFKW